jgi:hypothetical protein
MMRRVLGVSGESGRVWFEVTTPRQVIDDHFPTLARDGYKITSPRDDNYNCVAWIARDLCQWWEPGLDGGFWPRDVSEEELDAGDLAEYLTLFRSWGFIKCPDGELEDGIEKIAIHARDEQFAHVAYQRSDGEWSSKLGKLNDVRHECVASLSGCGAYEYPPARLFMARQREVHEPADSGFGLLLPGGL